MAKKNPKQKVNLISFDLNLYFKNRGQSYFILTLIQKYKINFYDIEST